MSHIRRLSILNLLSLLLHIAMSAVTQMKMINSKDVGQVSSLYPTLFTPAGYTFSIWGIIYLSLMAMCIYQLVLSFKATEAHPANRSVRKMSYLFIFNNLATAGWLYAFTQQLIGISEVLIALQLILLIIIHVRVGIYNPADLLLNKAFTQFPLSIYLGWISVATIANTAVLLQDSGWNRLGASESFWTSVIIGIAILIALTMVLGKNNITYGLVLIWALFGILSKLHELGTPPADIISTVWAGIGVTGFAIIIQLFRTPRNKHDFSFSNH